MTGEVKTDPREKLGDVFYPPFQDRGTPLWMYERRRELGINQADYICGLLKITPAAALALVEGRATVVPVEPTIEMLNAAIDVDSFKLGDISPLGFRESPQKLFDRCFKAMAAASPYKEETDA